MGEEHIIETHFDVLLSTLKEANEPLSAARLAEICGMREREVVKWLQVLEKSGQARIENRFNGIYASWIGEKEEEKSTPSVSHSAIDVGRQDRFEADLEIAHQREDDAASDEFSKKKKSTAPVAKSTINVVKHGIPVAKSNVSVESPIEVVDPRLERVDKMIRDIKSRRAQKEETFLDAIEREAMEGEETVATEISPKPAFERVPEENDEIATDADIANEEEAEKEGLAAKGEKAGKSRVLEIEEEARKLVPDFQARESWKAEQEGESEAEHESRPKEEYAPSARMRLPSKGVIRPKFRYAGVKPSKIAPVKKPAPLEITGVTLQFSERIERQMKKIERQAREIDSLRNEKEKLLSEHYLPLQNRLESELETISDRVLHIQSKVANLQKNAATLPAMISGVEKVQISSIKAHAEMRRAYDEACVLLEETGKQLADEREKMELILEQSQDELSRHSEMSGELHSTMDRIEEMEGEAASRVSAARAALAEQAERLANAENHSKDLRALREEIGGSISEMKREVASAKRVLSDLERQMGQMRKIEDYTDTIRKDYDAKMLQIDDYIRNGNSEFETLRESVEANFVRRYLRELRALTESYSFEFGQAKRMEGDIDARIAEERQKLEALFEEGKKISYLFETQARAPENADRFEKHAETFTALSDISSGRSQVAQMIAQVIGGRADSLPSSARISASVRRAGEPEPIGITKILARAKARKAKPSSRKGKAKPARKAKASARKSSAMKRIPLKASRAKASAPARKAIKATGSKQANGGKKAKSSKLAWKFSAKRKGKR